MTSMINNAKTGPANNQTDSREFVFIFLGLQQKSANSRKIGKRIREYHPCCYFIQSWTALYTGFIYNYQLLDTFKSQIGIVS